MQKGGVHCERSPIMQRASATFVITAKSAQRTPQRIESTTLLDNRQGLNLRAQSRKMLLAQVEPDIRNMHKHVVAH